MAQEPNGEPTPNPGGSQSANSGSSNSRRRRHKKKNEDAIRSSGFTGSTDSIKDHVYDVGPKSKDQFSTTTKEIAGFIARTVTHGGEFLNALDPDVLGFTPIDEPLAPTGEATQIQFQIWQVKYKRFEQMEANRKEASANAFAIIIGQCADTVMDRLEAQPTFTSLKSGSKVIDLLKLIRKSLYTGATRKNTCHSSQEAIEKIFNFKQGARMTNSTYLEKFKELMGMLEHFGIELGMERTRIEDKLDVDYDSASDEELELARLTAKQEYFAVLFIRHADNKRYGSLLADLENSQTRGVDQYPKTMTTAYDYLINYRTASSGHGYHPDEDGAAFYSNADSAHNPNSGRGGRGGGRYGGYGRGGGRNDSGRGGRNGGRGGRGNPVNQPQPNATGEEQANLLETPPQEGSEPNQNNNQSTDYPSSHAIINHEPQQDHLSYAVALYSSNSIPKLWTNN